MKTERIHYRKQDRPGIGNDTGDHCGNQEAFLPPHTINSVHAMVIACKMYDADR